MAIGSIAFGGTSAGLTKGQADSSYEGVVAHGSTAGTARPSSAVMVQWVGSVTPTNAITNDLWLDTSTSPATPRRHNGSAFEQVGGSSKSYATRAVARLTFR